VKFLEGESACAAVAGEIGKERGDVLLSRGHAEPFAAFCALAVS
jgi:hypothetical protein